jgi:hypothetical protein
MHTCDSTEQRGRKAYILVGVSAEKERERERKREKEREKEGSPEQRGAYMPVGVSGCGVFGVFGVRGCGVPGEIGCSEMGVAGSSKLCTGFFLHCCSNFGKTVVTPLLHCCYTGVAQLLHCCYLVLMRPAFGMVLIVREGAIGSCRGGVTMCACGRLLRVCGEEKHGTV